MTTPTVSVQLESRDTLGKKVKALRREGIVPVHLYGKGVASRPLQCEVRTLLQAISRAGGDPVATPHRGRSPRRLQDRCSIAGPNHRRRQAPPSPPTPVRADSARRASLGGYYVPGFPK